MAGLSGSPPRFVPTLTAVVHSASTTPELALHATGDELTDAAVSPEEQLLERVLQRIDGSLEQSLNGAVSAVLRQHVDAMLPLLRADLADILRTLVREALVQEGVRITGSVPSQAPTRLG